MIITDFYIKNLRWLYIVFILTFCSAFGQTFFISLYSGEIRAAFELTHGQWGLIYSCATLSSALLILFVGGYADRSSAKSISTLVILGLMVFIFLMANNTSTWGLVLIILGLRFFGQGMLGHISMVFCGKWFFKNKSCNPSLRLKITPGLRNMRCTDTPPEGSRHLSIKLGAAMQW